MTETKIIFHKDDSPQISNSIHKRNCEPYKLTAYFAEILIVLYRTASLNLYKRLFHMILLETAPKLSYVKPEHAKNPD